MKNLLLFALVINTTSLFAQEKISIDSVSKHIGEAVTVCSKVFGTKFLDKSQVTFLNVGAQYPDALLTIVIFGKDRINFKENPETMYADKQICVTGFIKQYKGKEEIIVSHPEEIKVQ